MTSMASTDLQESKRLPVGVVSTEAIEQLAPVLPEPSGKERHRKRRPRGVASGVGQVVLTSIPLICGDLLVVLGSFYGAILVSAALLGYAPHTNFFFQGLAVGVSFLGIGLLMGLYPATGVSPVFELRQLVLSGFFAFSLMLATNAMVAVLSPIELLVGIIGGIVAMLLLPIVRATVRHMVADRGWWGERVVIIGAGVQGQAIYKFYQRASQRGLRPVGLVDRWHDAQPLSPPLDADRYRYLGSIDRLNRIVPRHGVRWGILAPGGCDGMDVSGVMRFCGDLPHLIVLPSQLMIPSLWASPRECAGVMGVHVTDHLQSPVNATVKRAVDFFGSLFGLLAASPMFILAIAWTKWKSPGPAFYGHTRIGRDGKKFKAWKFRTMVPDADSVLEDYLERHPEMRREWIEDQKLKNDPRIIPGIGHFLRKTSLDEIPQLWNVLTGEMSLVGPRPIVQSEVERYREMFPYYLRVRPGITGLWQVSGRNDTSYDQRVQLDSYYVCNWSPWLDTYILLRTIRTMAMREGAY
ncbi:undecaprenyl-phosphate galactose phosphotransferase WbaP [Crateriforma spongiae]|uniref:undecaprenyl-phosphate galactose phosphotransferase WbaP n=1 Tax=Crateriforma spongiae TaxID=2724528 RepID=UPI001F01C617|nr:undecaprenyl-phosphate galactose phosphotransferase WbaP [Crateriforma spongiae]